jgi:hypothetical protein
MFLTRTAGQHIFTAFKGVLAFYDYRYIEYPYHNLGKHADTLEIAQVSYQSPSPQYLVWPLKQQKREILLSILAFKVTGLGEQ